jgi:hypothetical protein
MEMILKLTDSLGLFALLMLLLIGALSVLLVIAISAWEAVSVIKKHRIKKEEKKHTFLHTFTISKNETIDRFSLYKKIYAELKPLLIILGATEDQASRASNIYCVKHLNEIFNDYESATCDKKSDRKFTSKITYNK